MEQLELPLTYKTETYNEIDLKAKIKKAIEKLGPSQPEYRVMDIPFYPEWGKTNERY